MVSKEFNIKLIISFVSSSERPLNCFSVKVTFDRTVSTNLEITDWVDVTVLKDVVVVVLTVVDVSNINLVASVVWGILVVSVNALDSVDLRHFA